MHTQLATHFASLMCSETRFVETMGPETPVQAGVKDVAVSDVDTPLE